MYPTKQLSPGDQGEDVKQLQAYLVSKNYLTQAEMDTGPGIYGPKTTAAVARLQKDLGVDNTTGVGYYGPRTLEAITKSGLTAAPASATPIPPNPSTLNSTNITPTTPMNFSSPASTPAYPVGSLDVTVPTPPAQPTKSEQEASDLTKVLRELNEQMIGKSTYQAEQDRLAGVPEAERAVTDLAAQLMGLKNEAAAIPLQLQQEAEGRGITEGGLAPIQAGRLRENAIKALTTSSIFEAAKGNLLTAQSKADRAVAEKYGPIQERITASINNLNLLMNDPKTTLEDKNRAQMQLDIQNARQRELDKLKANDTAISNIALAAATNIKSFVPSAKYPSATIAIQAISNAKSPIEATQIATETGLVSTTTEKGEIVEANGRKLLIDKATGNIIKDLGAASSGSGTGTESERAAKAVATFSGTFIPGAKLPNGIPVLDSDGYLTPEAFRAAIADAPSKGLSREAFLQEFGYLITTPDGKISPKYGLTPNEIKIVTGTLPE